MNLDIIKKICAIIIGVAILIALGFFFFYIIIFALIAWVIYSIYRKIFKRQKTEYQEEPKSNTINNVIIDAEYEEKDN